MNNTFLENLEPRRLLALASGDFDGDGFDDMVIGSPFESLETEVVNPTTANGVGIIAAAGIVQVIYGSTRGLDDAGDQVWSLRSPDVKGNPAESDRFGNALAVGDFDNDGFDDLAIGIDGKDVDGANNAGAVLILYGTKNGLRAEGNKLISQDSKNVADGADAFDVFGVALASGDFDEDGFDDLAIGAPGEKQVAIDNAGVVHVLYGTTNGLRTKNSQVWHQDSSGIRGIAEVDDHFGGVLAAGDFDDNGADDLAIGNPWESVEELDRAGNVQVIYGSEGAGLTSDANQLFYAGNGLPVLSDQTAQLGYALAVGDFDDSGVDDLAVSSIGQIGDDVISYGAVRVLIGTTALRLVGTETVLMAMDFGLPTVTTPIGETLAAGDFDNDGFDDLIIGAHKASRGAITEGGLLIAVEGSEQGLDAAAYTVWHQGIDALNSAESDYDHFAEALGVGDFDGDGRSDLAVAAPGEDRLVPTAIADHGGVHVIHGFRAGLTSVSAVFWTQDSLGIRDEIEVGDRLGTYAHFVELLSA